MSKKKNSIMAVAEQAAIEDTSTEAVETTVVEEPEVEDNAQLVGKLDEYIAEVEALRKENNELRNENDKLLMNISDLTFQNAVLQASVDNLKNEQRTNENNLPRQQPQPCRNVNQNIVNRNLQIKRNNGYSSWN